MRSLAEHFRTPTPEEERLLRGEKPEALQQELFLSPSALRHREKNLMLWAGCAAREDWQAFRAFCRALPLLDE